MTRCIAVLALIGGLSGSTPAYSSTIDFTDAYAVSNWTTVLQCGLNPRSPGPGGCGSISTAGAPYSIHDCLKLLGHDPSAGAVNVHPRGLTMSLCDLAASQDLAPHEPERIRTPPITSPGRSNRLLFSRPSALVD